MRVALWVGIPGVILALLILALTRRLHIRLQYGEKDGFRMRLSYGALAFLSLPAAKRTTEQMSGRRLRRLLAKEEKRSGKRLLEKLKALFRTKKKSQPKSAQKPTKKKPSAPALVSSPEDVLHLIDLAVEFLQDGLYRHLHSRVRQLQLTVATGSADGTAYAYSAVMQGITALLALLDGGKSLRLDSAEAVSVRPDFSGGRTSLAFDVELAVAPYHFLAAGIRTGVRLLKTVLRSRNPFETSDSPSKPIPKKEAIPHGE